MSAATPDVASLLASLGGGGGGAPAPPPPPDQSGQQSSGSIEDAIRAVFDALDQLQQMGDIDAQDNAEIEKCRTMIAQIQAGHEKGQQSLMGGKMDVRALARATGSGGGGGGGAAAGY